MERLTTRNSVGVAVYKKPFECERCGETIYRLPDYGSGSPTDKLAAYEDAEDQGQYGKWIPVSERLPKPEEEVLVTAICRYKDGGCREIVIPAIYEDGTVLECNSNWYWEDIDGDWDEENDCLIIPEGWFEDRKYNPDCTYNCAIDDEVVAWMPKPESYRESEE